MDFVHIHTDTKHQRGAEVLPHFTFPPHDRALRTGQGLHSWAEIWLDGHWICFNKTVHEIPRTTELIESNHNTPHPSKLTR